MKEIKKEALRGEENDMSIFVDIEKAFADFKLKVAFEASDECLALLGASGSGKSMTLKCIAGIEKPDRGRIVLDGKTLYDSEKGINLPPQKRGAGLMFQNYALFPNMTVVENIEAGSKGERDKTKRDEIVRKVIDSFELGKIKSLYPHQLSGGQQQRVALARMLVSKPDIILLDEPFSALDSHLRFKLEQEVRNVIRAFGKTVILVSHNRDEVYRMADSIAIMNNGVVETIGSKQEVFANPVTKNGAMLTGCKNISHYKRLDNGNIYASDWGIEISFSGDVPAEGFLGIRMHSICLAEGDCPNKKNTFNCRVEEEIENPFSYTIMLRPLDCEIKSLIGWELDKEAWRKLRKEEICIQLPEEGLLFLQEYL